ncbi:MAG: hypothetical protein ACO4CS_17060 [bacterium]|jgi:hypothetical protein
MGVDAGEGDTTGVEVGDGEGFAAAVLMATPLFQRSDLPFFTQVNFFPL